MEYALELISRYKKQGLLVDTNLFLLYFIGIYDADRIPKFKRTMAFTKDEFLLLATIFDEFEKIITTPNVLTEVSNLLGQLPDDLKAPFFNSFAERIPGLVEEYVPSAAVSGSSNFRRFGLTDSGILDTIRNKYLLLTTDLELCGFLQNLGIDVINFNHIRSLAW